jgi:hypothetical protein
VINQPNGWKNNDQFKTTKPVKSSPPSKGGDVSRQADGGGKPAEWLENRDQLKTTMPAKKLPSF